MTKQRSNQWQWVFILGGLLAIGGIVASSSADLQETKSRGKENRMLINKGDARELHRFDRIEDKLDYIIKAVK